MALSGHDTAAATSGLCRLAGNRMQPVRPKTGAHIVSGAAHPPLIWTVPDHPRLSGRDRARTLIAIRCRCWGIMNPAPLQRGEQNGEDDRVMQVSGWLTAPAVAFVLAAATAMPQSNCQVEIEGDLIIVTLPAPTTARYSISPPTNEANSIQPVGC